MTKEKALEKIKKSMECHDRKVCGLAETCEECPLYVDKDTEYEAHKVLIKALSQEPQKNTLDGLFKNIKKWEKEAEQEPCTDAQERYEDLCEYFGDAKDILKSRKDFKAWLERIKWHIRKAEELYEKYEHKKEPCDDAVSREAVLDAIFDYWYKKNIIGGSGRDVYDDCAFIIKQLPSVNPQPCSDAISREAVREILAKYHLGESRMAEELNELPPITQKPIECEDAISRQAVLDEAFEVDTKEYGRIDVVGVDAIDALPSVTQKLDIGHWLYSGENGADRWTCDNCFDFVKKPTTVCPNCGAKMESEE